MENYIAALALVVAVLALGVTWKLAGLVQRMLGLMCGQGGNGKTRWRAYRLRPHRDAKPRPLRPRHEVP
jgi:hypothetical protein